MCVCVVVWCGWMGGSGVRREGKERERTANIMLIKRERERERMNE